MVSETRKTLHRFTAHTDAVHKSNKKQILCTAWYIKRIIGWKMRHEDTKFLLSLRISNVNNHIFIHSCIFWAHFSRRYCNHKHGFSAAAGVATTACRVWLVRTAGCSEHLGVYTEFLRNSRSFLSICIEKCTRNRYTNINGFFPLRGGTAIFW